jgi:hypothetical protein
VNEGRKEERRVPIDIAGFSGIAEYGVGIVAIVVIYLLVSGIVKGFLEMWKRSVDSQDKSTDALNRNSEAYQQLSNVFKASHEREIEFQKESLVLLRDIHSKTTDIHAEVSKRN